jgi:hypothetical protein
MPGFPLLVSALISETVPDLSKTGFSSAIPLLSTTSRDITVEFRDLKIGDLALNG